MTWHYAIRERRIVEVFEGIEADPGHDGAPYAILGWRDTWHILRALHLVLPDIWYDWRRRRSA